MNILIAGGTGFIGRYLIPALIDDHHNISVISRNVEKVHANLSDRVSAFTWPRLKSLDPEDFDVVINLCGKNIGDGKWTEEVRNEIISSRVETTSQLARWCAQGDKKPHLYNASAIGFYGLQKTTSALPPPLNESNQPASTDHFIHKVGKRWEDALTPAITANVPVTIMRFGVVLKKDEGALKKMQPSFYFGLGGKLGNGCQAFSWIHVEDLVRAIQFLLKHQEITGPVNIVSPNCIQQKEFACCLGKAMSRPTFMTMPSFVLKSMFGQMANELLLNGQNVYPQVLVDKGFGYVYPSIDKALDAEWRC